GTTRDRIYGEYQWRGRDVAVVDTGGIIPDADEGIAESIYEQAELAIDEADAIVFLVDGARASHRWTKRSQTCSAVPISRLRWPPTRPITSGKSSRPWSSTRSDSEIPSQCLPGGG